MIPPISFQVDAKVRDLYTKFERSCVWSLVESVTSEAHLPLPPAPPGDAPLRTDAALHTTVALYTAHDAQLLVSDVTDLYIAVLTRA